MIAFQHCLFLKNSSLDFHWNIVAMNILSALIDLGFDCGWILKRRGMALRLEWISDIIAGRLAILEEIKAGENQFGKSVRFDKSAHSCHEKQGEERFE